MKEIFEEIRIFVFGKERTLTKTIINWGFILLLIAGFTEYGIDHNGDMSGLLKKETWETNSPKTENLKGVSNKKVYLRTLGYVDEYYIIKTKKIISEKFGVEVEIIEKVDPNPEMFVKEGFTGSDRLLKFLPIKGKTITLVGYKILADDDGKKLGGFQNGLNILVSTKINFFEKALVHEYGHSLFLNHCQDKTCVMSTNRKTGTNFCKNCKNTIGL